MIWGRVRHHYSTEKKLLEAAAHVAAGTALGNVGAAVAAWFLFPDIFKAVMAIGFAVISDAIYETWQNWGDRDNNYVDLALDVLEWGIVGSLVSSLPHWVAAFRG